MNALRRATGHRIESQLDDAVYLGRAGRFSSVSPRRTAGRKEGDDLAVHT